MKKKRFIKPQMKCYKVESTQILAGSDMSVGGGYTGEQKAKGGLNFFDDELTNEDAITITSFN